jgi:hypothetical protein
VRYLLALLLRQLDDVVSDVHLHRCRRARRNELGMLEGWWTL